MCEWRRLLQPCRSSTLAGRQERFPSAVRIPVAISSTICRSTRSRAALITALRLSSGRESTRCRSSRTLAEGRKLTDFVFTLRLTKTNKHAVTIRICRTKTQVRTKKPLTVVGHVSIVRHVMSAKQNGKPKREFARVSFRPTAAVREQLQRLDRAEHARISYVINTALLRGLPAVLERIGV